MKSEHTAVSLAHIINLVGAQDNPGLFKVQELTMRTIERALAGTRSDLKVQIMSAQYTDARPFVPGFVSITSDLLRSSADFKQLNTKLRLPVLGDIIMKLRENTEATHFVFTNLDICVMPSFYNAVASYLNDGYDAIIINRRRINAEFIDEPNLDVLFAEAGKTHTGYDCFVFSRALLDKFVFGDIFIGTPPAGNDLFYNIMTFADCPVLLTEKHLTFHVGMDLVKPWGESKLNSHNQAEFLKLLKKLYPSMRIANFPGAGYGFMRRHFKWLMNPTFHYPTMCRLDFSQWSAPRRKPQEYELKGLKNAYYEWLLKKINFRDKD
ncbi:MAG: hypothetical protein L6Q81_01395 [Bacteroidia bacterium]|nr:hypothetical protein [Bacteroidia bacterium]